MAGRDRRETSSGNRRQMDDDEEEHVYCFVPGEGIDVVVLAAYLKRWVDGTATIQPTRHPKDPDRIGYTVGASSTLNREALEDLLADTRKWQKEQSSRDFRRSPYDYSESDTFQDRKKKGPTPGSTAIKLAKPRDRKAATTDTAAGRPVPITADSGRGRHDVETDNPPPYGQSQSYTRDARGSRDNREARDVRDARERADSGSRSPRPRQPSPDSFQKLTISDDQNRPNQGARVQGATGTGRHTAANTSGTTKYILKTPGTGNDQGKKGSRHDENWH